MIKKLYAKLQLNILLKNLKNQGQLPSSIEVGELGPYLVVNILDTENPSHDFLAGNVCTGMSRISEIAWLKAISEWIERKAFLENKLISPARFSRESDGCAAYSHAIIGKKAAKKLARENALDEAIERYVWGSWWDQKSAADIKVLSADSLFMKMLNSFSDENVKPQKLYVIAPKFDKYTDRQVLILFLSLTGGGFISGGACGSNKESENTFDRAFVELLRHFLGYSRMRKSSLEPISFYDKRLSFFANGSGDPLVWDRLHSKNQEFVKISNVEYDSILNHKLQNITTVHHIQFENPPFFLEGPLERLCI